MASDGYFRDIVEAALLQGWKVEKTKKNHWQFKPPKPGMPIVVTSSTPSDLRTMSNFLSRMRQSGFNPKS